MRTLFVALSLLISSISIAQTYRVAKISFEMYPVTNNQKIFKSEKAFSYTDNKLLTITETIDNNSTVYTVEQKGRKFTISSGKDKVIRKVVLDKVENMESNDIPDGIDINYNKNILPEAITNKDGYNKQKSKYLLYYNDDNKLQVVAHNETSSQLNYLLFYDQNNKCNRAELGSGNEDITAEWKGDKIVNITGYQNGSAHVSNHQFVYDSKGLLTEEKIFEKQKDGTEKLIRYYKLDYEEGVGNEDKLYFAYRNWKLNVFFNQKTCQSTILLAY